MKRILSTLGLGISIFMLSAPPSWAWVSARFGFGYGYHGYGPRVNIGITPWWYGPSYYYAPTTYYDAPPDYYAPAPNDTTPVDTNNSRVNTKVVLDEIARQRAAIKFRYSDGEISSDERDTTLRSLDAVERETRADARANGGSLTAEDENTLEQELGLRSDDSDTQVRPPALAPQETVSNSENNNEPQQSITSINDMLLELRTLLTQKLKDGDITRAQRNSELQVLAQIESRAHTDAGKDGKLPNDEEKDLMQQLNSSYYTIVHNFMSDPNT